MLSFESITLLPVSPQVNKQSRPNSHESRLGQESPFCSHVSPFEVVKIIVLGLCESPSRIFVIWIARVSFFRLPGSNQPGSNTLSSALYSGKKEAIGPHPFRRIAKLKIMASDTDLRLTLPLSNESVRSPYFQAKSKGGHEETITAPTFCHHFSSSFYFVAFLYLIYFFGRDSGGTIPLVR